MRRQVRFAIVAAVALLAPVAAQAKWREASSKHFVIYSEEKPESLRAFAERLERFDGAMRFLRQLPDPDLGPNNRVTVYVVSNLQTVQRLAAPGGGGSGIAGFYVPRAGGSIAIIPRRGLGSGRYDMDAETVLLHEYAHHFLYANYALAYPMWFSEGYAEFHSTARFEEDGSVDLGVPAAHRFYSLVMGDNLPVDRMMAMGSENRSSATTEALYARGWLLTHYLMFEPSRRGQLDTYLRALNAGKASPEAAVEAFGDLKKLNKDLANYQARKKMNYLKVAKAAVRVGEIALRELSAGEDAVMDLKIRSRRGVTEEEAKTLIGPMRRAAGPFPNDAAVQATLAEAEYDAGNLAEAEAAADRAIAANPQAVAGHLYKARVLLARAEKDGGEARWGEARRALLAANRIDPNHPEPLILFYNSFDMAGRTPTANAVSGLNRAFDLAPQDRGLRMLTARQYLVDGKGELARRALAPIAFDPHAGEVAIAASAIVQEIETGGTAEALKKFDAGDKSEAEPDGKTEGKPKKD